MWGDHAVLNRIATALYSAAALAALYGLLVTVMHLPVFALRAIDISGETSRTTREQVAALVTERVRGTFFTLDLESARSSFESLPWVRRANLRRMWPDRIEVRLEEHVALARWRDAGLVNVYGEVFQATASERLPLFSGPDGSAPEIAEQYRAFVPLLARIGRVPVEIRLSARRAWEVRLDDGHLLELGRQDVSGRLARYVGVYQRTLARLPPAPYRVDLRYSNGFAVRIPNLRWDAVHGWTSLDGTG